MRIVRYVFVQACLALTMWGAFWQGSDGARNIALVVVWLKVAAALISVIGRNEIAEKIAKEPRRPGVPRPLSHLVDMLFGAALIWHGHIAAGVAYLLHIGMVDVMQDAIEAKRKEIEAARVYVTVTGAADAAAVAAAMSATRGSERNT